MLTLFPLSQFKKMSFCTDPNSIIPIDINECVGNSLTTMNTNFDILKDEVCNQYSNVLSSETEKNILTNYTSSLSSQLNLTPKCSVKFDNDSNIVSQEGISEVTKQSIGIFRVYFSNNFNNTNYLTIASSVSEIPCFVFVSEEYPNYIEIHARASDGNLTDPNFINLVFFS